MNVNWENTGIPTSFVHFMLLLLYVGNFASFQNVYRNRCLEVCRATCEMIKSKEFMEYCHCWTNATNITSVSLLGSAETRAIVGMVKWPVDYWTCKDHCTSLKKWRYHHQTKACILGKDNEIMENIFPANTSLSTPSVGPTMSRSTTSTKNKKITGTGCDQRCVPPNYVCNAGKCECSLVYKQTTDGICIAECSSYGHDFLLQKSDKATCLTTRDNKYENIVSSEECKQHCLKEDFQCVFYELMDGGKCYTKQWKQKYLKPVYWFDAKVINCKHYTRQCDHASCDETCVPPNYVCNRGACECGLAYSRTTDGRCVPACGETCIPPNYMCNRGDCVCGLVYSRTTDGKCVPGCASYSEEFILQRSNWSTCLNRRDNMYEHIASSDECRQHCLNETFICVFYEIDGDTCYTKHWNKKYLQSIYWIKSKYCKHYTRRCDHEGK